ncbi:hypothetical protein [Zavarzinella formosa]|uniref:hypothetical protein n=1 Tax=Zavarzinella formosa TaxID=360055 RepID=UPI0012F93D10|nr:hypothetical protein [Zavarzinella formosa]
MGATFADQPLVDPKTLYDQCRMLGLRQDWVGLANGLCNPAGVRSGIGHLLMTRASLDLIDFNTPQSLSIFHEPTSTQIDFESLVITECEAITPSFPGDPDAVFHVRVADIRHLWRFAVIDAGFNLRETPTGNYRKETTFEESGTPHTWQQMFDAVWETLPADYRGDTPTLPEVTEGTPEAFDFYATYTIDAIEMILARLGCALTFNPTADPEDAIYSVVPLGDPDAYETFTASVDDLARLRLDDNEGLEGNLGRVPAQVNVLFRKQMPVANGENPWHTITVADPNDPVPGQLEDTTVWLIDDLTADYQGDTLTNVTGLTSRADSRAAEYFRSVRRDGHSLRRLVYSGAQISILPGEWVSEVSWFDRGGGVMTEVKLIPDNGQPTAEWPGNKPQAWRETEIVRPDDESEDEPPEGYTAGKVVRYDATTGEWVDRHDCWIRDTDT